jgi:hypothetical protein
MDFIYGLKNAGGDKKTTAKAHTKAAVPLPSVQWLSVPQQAKCSEGVLLFYHGFCGL